MRRQYHPNDMFKTLGNKGHGICRRKVQCRGQTNHQDRIGQSRRGTNQIVVIVNYQVLIKHRDDKAKYRVLNNHQDNNVVKYQVQVNQRNDEVMYRVRMHHQERRGHEAMPRIHRHLVDNRAPHTLGRVRDTLGRDREQLQRSIRFIPRWGQKQLERSVKFQGQLFLRQKLRMKLELEMVADDHREQRAIGRKLVLRIVN